MLSLRSNLLRSLIEMRFGGPSGLALNWPTAFDPPPNRATVWRWLNAYPSMKPRCILGLASALDLDPFSLFEKTELGYAALCRTLSVRLGKTKTKFNLADLAWAAELVNPSGVWPPQTFANRFYKRNWFIEHFTHDASKTNYYQKILLLTCSHQPDLPQVWHFAFRNLLLPSPQWSPYGFVESAEKSVGRYKFSGSRECVEVALGERRLCVETWFGGGKAEFRIASLHSFQLRLVDCTGPNIPTVRF
jgi:hypothetical protein